MVLELTARGDNTGRLPSLAWNVGWNVQLVHFAFLFVNFSDLHVLAP